MEHDEDDLYPQVNASQVLNVNATTNVEPAPTIHIRMSSLNGTSLVQVLPDSGADVSVAGLAFLNSLSEPQGNLLHSDVKPRAVNGMTMSPMGKLPVTMSLGSAEYSDEFHIYPEVKGTLISWKAAKKLGNPAGLLPQPSTLCRHDIEQPHYLRREIHG